MSGIDAGVLHSSDLEIELRPNLFQVESSLHEAAACLDFLEESALAISQCAGMGKDGGSIREVQVNANTQSGVLPKKGRQPLQEGAVGHDGSAGDHALLVGLQNSVAPGLIDSHFIGVDDHTALHRLRGPSSRAVFD